MKINIGKYPKTKPQKVVVEIERHDTWNMGHTLALIIYPMLLKLKEEKQGIPSEFADAGGEDYVDQKSFDFYEDSHKWAFDEKVKQWDVVLDKMIWSFEQKLKDDDENEFFDHSVSKGMPWDKDYVGPKYDKEGHDKWQERKSNGFRLFGKYYEGLWD